MTDAQKEEMRRYQLEEAPEPPLQGRGSDYWTTQVVDKYKKSLFSYPFPKSFADGVVSPPAMVKPKKGEKYRGKRVDWLEQAKGYRARDEAAYDKLSTLGIESKACRLNQYLPHPGGIAKVPMNKTTGLPEPYELNFPEPYRDGMDPDGAGASWVTFMLQVVWICRLIFGSKRRQPSSIEKIAAEASTSDMGAKYLGRTAHGHHSCAAGLQLGSGGH